MPNLRSEILKNHIKQFTLLGIMLSIVSIIIATILVSYQMYGSISIMNLIQAQRSNPAIWILDLTPFVFIYWGQLFCYKLTRKAESIIEHQTQEFINHKDDLEIKLKYQSTHDNLTNLPNYRLFVERVKQAISQIENDWRAMIIIISINEFKEINYGFGSFHANNLLKQFSEKLKTLMLEPYMLGTYMGINVIARLRNDEFAILLPRIHQNIDIDNLLKQISQYTSVNLMIEGININIVTTIGASLYPIHGTTAETLIMHAADSIYFANKENKNYAIFQKGMQNKTKINRETLDEFEQTLDDEQASLCFYPHIELTTGRVIGAETSVKLENSELEVFHEEKLFQLMDGSRYSKKLALFLVKKAFQQLEIWQKSGYQSYIEVDLSTTDLSDPELLSLITDGVKRFAPELFKISLTEKSCLSDQARTLSILNQLASLGIILSIKDFSTGYTSFSYLTYFPIKEIKIDQSFVMKMAQDAKKNKTVKTIIQIAQALNLNIIASGINNQQTIDQLIDLGCKYGQGQFVGAALTAEELVERFNLEQNTMNQSLSNKHKDLRADKKT